MENLIDGYLEKSPDADLFPQLSAVRWPEPSRLNRFLPELRDHARRQSAIMPIPLEFPYRENLVDEVPALAAMAYPDVCYDDLCMAYDWIKWLFLFDDQNDDGPLGRSPGQMRDAIGGLLDVVKDGEERPGAKIDDPTVALLGSFCRQLKARASTTMHDRFSHHVIEYLSANSWEMDNRVSGTLPPPEIYLEKRQQTGAVYSCFDLICLFHAIIPNEADWMAHDIGTLEFLACLVICLTNDVISSRKETRNQDFHNLVLIYMTLDGCSEFEASRRVTTMVQHHIDTFETIAARLQAPERGAPARLVDYARGLRSWMVANYEWSLTCARYRDA